MLLTLNRNLHSISATGKSTLNGVSISDGVISICNSAVDVVVVMSRYETS